MVFYQPRYGNYEHWALYLADDAEPLIFEVVGSHGTFKPNIVKAKPENSARYVGRQFVDNVNIGDIPEMRNAIKACAVDNETVEWDCQDYAIEALEKLAEECVIDEEISTFKRAMRALKDRRGAVQ